MSLDVIRLLLDDEPGPHPLLVAKQEVTPTDVIMVAALRGWLSEDRVFRPAVQAER